MIRAEVSGNAYLLPQYQLGEDGAEFFAADGLVGQRRRPRRTGTSSGRSPAPTRSPTTSCGRCATTSAIAHPQLLTYQAWGPAADGAGVLGLCATADVPIDEPTAPATAAAIRGRESVLNRLALKPADRDDLLRIVGEPAAREVRG